MQDGEASRTAQGVAAHRRSFARVAAPYGRPDDDQRLQDDVAGDLDPPQTPFSSYLQARTAFVDRAVVDAIDHGIGQLVAVGAGYDGRSLRYAAPGVRWFELDHPDTQRDKLARLERLEVDASAIAFAAADFGADDVAAALVAADLDPGAPSAFVCEGVAGYLPAAVLTRLLEALASVAPAGSRLAITLGLVPNSDAAADRRERLRTTVAALGEPLSSSVPRTELADRLAATGWTVDRAIDPRGEPVERSESNAALVLAHR